MKSSTLMFVIAMALLTPPAMPLRLAAQEQQNKNLPHYTVTVLGTLGGTFGEAWGINNRGSMVGHSFLSGDQESHAFLWRQGVIRDLGTLGGPNSSNAFNKPINNRGAISGYSDTSTPDPNGEDFCGFGKHLVCLPFVWEKDVMNPLPLLGGNNGQAGGSNNRGLIVGVSETPNSDPCSFAFLQVEATIWQNDIVQELPPFPGDAIGAASAINDKDQAVGATGCVSTNTVRAVLWQNGPNGRVIDLGNLGGAGGNIAMDINNKGQIVGQSDLSGDTTHHAFLWTEDDGMQDLGTLPGIPGSLANGINNKGQVVGFSDDFKGNTVALLWQNGAMTDLNTLIPPNSRLFLLEALSINDRGQIAGFGQLSDGEHRGFLLTPCDEKEGGDGDKGCGEDGGGNAVSQTSPAVRNAASGTLPQSLLHRMDRYHLASPAFGPRN